jgi:spore coat protein CotH
VREQKESNESSVIFNADSDSDVTSQSDSHEEKHLVSSFSTHRGIIIFLRDEEENGCDSVNFNKTLPRVKTEEFTTKVNH